MMIKFLNMLGIVKGVYLIDFEGQIYKSWKKRDLLGQFYSHVYPFCKVGFCRLNHDGTVGSSYVRRWVDMGKAIEALREERKNIGRYS